MVDEDGIHPKEEKVKAIKEVHRDKVTITKVTLVQVQRGSEGQSHH